MSLPKIDILVNLFADFTSCNVQENLQEVIIEGKFKSILIPSPDDFKAVLHCLNSRDKLQLSIIFEGAESIDFNGNDIDSFLAEITTSAEIKEVDSDILVSFKILKTFKEGVISSYFNNNLIDELLSMELKGALYIFHQFFNVKKHLIIESQYEDINVQTPTICIINDISKCTFSELSFRGSKISKLKSVAFFSIINQYEFLPEDFHILESSHEKAACLFNKLCEVFSIGFLFDETNVEPSAVLCKLNGFKALALQIEFKTLVPDNHEQFFKIYDWCYNEGNFNDKIGLSRNVISLHIEDISAIKLKGDAFQSLLSNYRIYEKQNIKQYIEIRNKISEQLLSFNDRANKIVETFASGFQKSALALISFYISAIAIKLLGKGEFVNLFTLDATVLAVGFIVCSFIYFFFSSWEVRVQRQRFIDSYSNLKSRYLDLLDENDINRILNSDKEYNADLKFITDKKRNYSIMWLLFLGILLAITLFLFFTYNLTQLFDTRLWHILFSKSHCAN